MIVRKYNPDRCKKKDIVVEELDYTSTHLFDYIPQEYQTKHDVIVSGKGFVPPGKWLDTKIENISICIAG